MDLSLAAGVADDKADVDLSLAAGDVDRSESLEGQTSTSACGHDYIGHAYIAPDIHISLSITLQAINCIGPWGPDIHIGLCSDKCVRHMHRRASNCAPVPESKGSAINVQMSSTHNDTGHYYV